MGFVNDVVNGVKDADIKDWHFWVGIGILAVGFFVVLVFLWWACTCQRRRRNKRIQKELANVDVEAFWKEGGPGSPSATTAIDTPVRARGHSGSAIRTPLSGRHKTDSLPRMPSSQSPYAQQPYPAQTGLRHQMAAQQQEIQPVSGQQLYGGGDLYYAGGALARVPPSAPPEHQLGPAAGVYAVGDVDGQVAVGPQLHTDKKHPRSYLALRHSQAQLSAGELSEQDSQGIMLAQEIDFIAPAGSSGGSSTIASQDFVAAARAGNQAAIGGVAQAPPGGASLVSMLGLAPIRCPHTAFKPGKHNVSVSEDALYRLGVCFWRLHASRGDPIGEARRALGRFYNEIIELELDGTQTAEQAAARMRVPLHEELFFVEHVVGTIPNCAFVDVMDELGEWVRIPVQRGDLLSLRPQLPYRPAVQPCTYARLIRAYTV